MQAPSPAERLGYGPEARLIIISCGDLGFCHAANEGVYRALRNGLGTSGRLMVPGPWARHAASAYRGEDVGIRLTLNAEQDLYRWGPITHAPSLLDGDGGFPRTLDDTWEHADLDEVRRECRAQVERAVYWGFDVSYVDSHLEALVRRPEFFDVYLELALDFRLPLRLPGTEVEHTAGFPFRSLAAAEGAVFPDHVVVPGALGRAGLERALQELRPGVTEVSLHPAADTPELRALDPHWSRRLEDLELVRREGLLAELIRRTGAVLVGYRELRRLARAGLPRA
ncbi:MAG: ChbG/HpnK family deacetylase [Acidimicrobiales bacterium]